MSDGEHFRPQELELYALGGLPEEEAAALKAHVADCGECAMKLAQAHGSAALLAFTAKQERPAGTIKAELMARIRENRETEERFTWPLRTRAPGPVAANGSMESESNPDSRWWNWVLVPAAVALAVVSLGLSWQNRRLAAKLTREHQAAESMVRERGEIEKLVRFLAAPDTLTVKLAGTEGTSRASGVVKYNGKMGILMYSADLPALPADKSYRMWLMPVNGAPVDAGQLGPGKLAMGNLWTAQVPANTTAKEFAVTIEPARGAPQPTGPRVLFGAN